MPFIFDNGCQYHVDPDIARKLERAGMVTRCQCEEACDGPAAAYHPTPGKTISDVRFYLNESRHV